MRRRFPEIAPKTAILFFTTLFLLIAAPSLMAQSQTISGTVVDPSGGVVPGAAVRITDSAKGTLARELTTNEVGRFEALNMQPGPYSIEVEIAGFKKAQRTVTLDVNTRLDIGQIRLEIGQVTETVTITEAIPLVSTATMEKAYLVEPTQISALPMNGRFWTSLMSTVPGMTSGSRNDFDMNFNDVSYFHANGGRGSQNNFYLDGSPNLDVGDNQSQYTQPSIDSIAEFKIQQSSFNAEYGRNSGMVVAVQTKSGANSFHGTLYEYVRNNALDAMNTGFSDRWNTLRQQSPNAQRKDVMDKLRYNQFGGNISGWVPIPKISTAKDKKVFFFYNREMTRRIVAVAGTKYTDVPAPDILNGDFRAWLLTTNMDYAPQFKNGTIFQPGTIKRDGAGRIIDGVPFANNTVPKSMWQPLSSNILKIYNGIPGYTSLPDAPNPGYKRYYWTAPSKLHKDQDLVRVDYAVSSRLNTFFRWVNDYQKEEIANGIWAGEPFPIQPQYRPKPGSSWSWNIVNTFSPTLASETILAYNHQSQELGIIEPNPIDRNTLGTTWTQLYPAANITNSVANVNASPISFSLGAPGWHNDGKDYALTENVTWVKKSHVLKFGFHYNRDNKKQTGNWGFNGDINFNSSASLPQDTGSGLANLMLGNFQSYSMANAHVYPYFRFQSWEGFAQDSWKVTKRLTLEYGVRFQKTTPTYTYTRDGSPPLEGTWKTWSADLARYDPSKRPFINVSTGRIVGNAQTQLSAIGLICDPCSGVPRGFADALSLFAPRLGFAYDLSGNGKMALRGGFGIYYERLRQNNFNFGAGGHWPNTTSATALYGNVANVDTSIVNQPSPEITPPGFNIFPKDNVMPSIYSWNLGIQRELPARFALDLSYVGNHAIHLMQHRSINGLPAGTFIKYPDLSRSVNYKNDALRPYYGFGGLTAVETGGYSSYNAMQLRISRRFTNRLAFNFNYTWSRAFNLGDNDDTGVRNPYNVRDSWAPAGYDQTNVITLDYIYQFPNVKGILDKWGLRAVLNGWEISGITRYQSGQPFTVSSNGSTQGIDSGGVYPNLVGYPYAAHGKWRWLDPAAFRRPMDGEYGNLHRNTLRLPDFANFDATLSKTVWIDENVRLAIRCEVFNLFNHPVVWGINTGFTSDNQGGPISSANRNFGIPTSWREPRILQFGFRFSF